MTKKCKKCLEEKPLSSFNRASGNRDGLRGECSLCQSKYYKQYYKNNDEKIKKRKASWREQNKESYQAYFDEWRYGIDRKVAIRLRKKRKNSKCHICGLSAKDVHKNILYIDHDHSDGKLRGLLCDKCNRGLGYFRDNQEFLRNAADYLENPPGIE